MPKAPLRKHLLYRKITEQFFYCQEFRKTTMSQNITDIMNSNLKSLGLRSESDIGIAYLTLMQNSIPWHPEKYLIDKAPWLRKVVSCAGLKLVRRQGRSVHL